MLHSHRFCVSPENQQALPASKKSTECLSLLLALCSYSSPSCCPSHWSLISTLAELWVSWFHSNTLEQRLYIPPRKPIPASTFCVLSFLLFALRIFLFMHVFIYFKVLQKAFVCSAWPENCLKELYYCHLSLMWVTASSAPNLKTISG